jgi:hypothetical protein
MQRSYNPRNGVIRGKFTPCEAGSATWEIAAIRCAGWRKSLIPGPTQNAEISARLEGENSHDKLEPWVERGTGREPVPRPTGPSVTTYIHIIVWTTRVGNQVRTLLMGTTSSVGVLQAESGDLRTGDHPLSLLTLLRAPSEPAPILPAPSSPHLAPSYPILFSHDCLLGTHSSPPATSSLCARAADLLARLA